MDRPIVSIIIPVYNVEEYVSKAVESICGQTLTNWELFLVDDGSADRSGAICDELAADDDRIHVIHQDNQGAAKARNAAIDQASGKYLYFMDADDWATEGMLYDLVCLAENYEFDAWAGVPMDNSKRNLQNIGRVTYDPQNMIAEVPEERCAQMVISGFFIETYYTDMDYYLQKQAVTPRVFASNEEFRAKAHELFDRNLLYTPWNKLYLASYIKENNIYFPAVHWDDFPFNLEVIRHIDRVTVTDHAYYHFIRKRTDSESEKYNVGLYEKREEENKWLLDLYEGWRVEKQQILIAEMQEKQALIAEKKAEAEAEAAKIAEAKAAEDAKVVEEIEATTEAKVAEEVGKIVEEDMKAAAEEEIKLADASTLGENKAEGQNTEVKPEPTVEVIDPDEAAKAAVGDDEEAIDDTVQEAVNKVEKAKLVVDDGVAVDGEAVEVTESEDVNFNFLDKEATSVPVVNIPSPEASEFIARRYLERIVGCVENVTNPACELSKKEKYEEIKKIISQDSVRDALKTAKPKSLYMKLMLVPFRVKSAEIAYLEGTLISKVKTKNVKLFAKLKANR